MAGLGRAVRIIGYASYAHNDDANALTFLSWIQINDAHVTSGNYKS